MNFLTKKKSDHPKIKAKTIFCLSLVACMNLIFGGKNASAQSSLPPFTCDGYPYQVLSGELMQLAGLSFTYANDVGYSDSATRPADFSACTYTPAAGYDPNVTYICFNPKGTLVADDPDPTFSVSFRARIK